ncbi:hypothetical protein V5799_007087 [Amblyomma americanum]|uniref:Peptidase S1 domain-containing protein n=1 Tax=Amblyomma americanum TaxID=6943 RepID=A0AAQ4DUJ3_AMBAM
MGKTGTTRWHRRSNICDACCPWWCFSPKPLEVHSSQGCRCISGDTCTGDSGGPLMRGVKDEEVIWTQTGIVSWGQAVCKKNKHSFYTDVSHYMDWIQHHLKNGTAPVANV